MKSLTLDTNESPESVPSRLSISDCIDEFAVPERTINFKELLITTPSGVTRTTLDATLKKRVLIMGNYPIPNADVSSMYFNPTEEVISDENYLAVIELSETVISSLNTDEIYIRRSPHIRELKVVSSLIYSDYTKVKWLPKRLHGLLSNGPSTHALLKDRNNLLHISSNHEGKVTLLHICKRYSVWRLYGYCVINLDECEVRDV